MKTNLDGVLRTQWSCEHCHTVFEGVSPPNDCDVCGSTKFDNALDLASKGVLPVPTRGRVLNGPHAHSKPS